jgi:quercetin dioxygenase-like cupin family protein
MVRRTWCLSSNDDRFGSKAVFRRCPRHVCLYPKSGAKVDIPALRIRARSGHAHLGCGHSGNDQELETLLACLKHFASKALDTDMIIGRTFTRNNTLGGMLMKRVSLMAGLLLVGLLPLPATAADDHVVVSADNLKWGPAPPAFPKGAQIAVVTGDPSKEGLYVYRIKLPAGYKVPAHYHPNDENITVISGTFHIGMGDKLDEKKGDALKAGGFALQPKGMAHYAWFTEDTIIQVHGMGPGGITYVNPSDDPRKSN